LSGGLPINLHSYMKYKVLRRLGQRTDARCLIETGTFLGVTAARCARVFDRVFTIELDATLCTSCADTA
jgi:protein-L-isoaspartate O-methyltransferase